jgi:hypothetical protein
MMLSIAIGVPSTSFCVVSFAEGPDVVFLSGSDGIHAVTLESGQVRKVYGRGHFYRIYMLCLCKLKSHSSDRSNPRS